MQGQCCVQDSVDAGSVILNCCDLQCQGTVNAESVILNCCDIQLPDPIILAVSID